MALGLVVYGHQDAAEKFTLGTKAVRQVRQYTYLGLEIARSLGFWRPGREAELLRGKRFVDDDEGAEWVDGGPAESTGISDAALPREAPCWKKP